MFVYAGFTAVTEKPDEIIERLPPPRQPQGTQPPQLGASGNGLCGRARCQRAASEGR
jgi:hypothetical protein